MPKHKLLELDKVIDERIGSLTEEVVIGTNVKLNPAVVQGYYLILKPLPPGEHLLKYSYLSESNSTGTIQNTPGMTSYSLTVN